MYFFKENTSSIVKSLNNKGICVVKSFFKKKDIIEIKQKAQKFLNIPKYLGPAFNVKLVSQDMNSKSKLRGLSRDIGIKISKRAINKGPKYYSKLTNSIEIIDPLLNFSKINDYVFQKDILLVAKKYLKTNFPKLLYVAVRVHFNNKIPSSDFNLFHVDDRTHLTKSKNKLLKLLIPFHLKKGKRIEFNQLIISKNKMNIGKKVFDKLQYSKKKDFPKRFKIFFIKPNVKNQDAYFFNPNDFFHNAEKPKRLRIMLYLVFGKKNSYLVKKTGLIKIKKKYFKQLSPDLKNFGSFLKKI